MNQRYNIIRRGLASLPGVALATALLLPATAAAQNGAVTGTVTDATTGQPIDGTLISFLDTELVTLSNADGRFLITSVPAGTYTVQTKHVGYATASEEVTVTAGGTARVEFALAISAVALDEIIVTGTAGAVERRKLGVSAASLNVSDQQERIPLNSFSELMEGRMAGVRSVGAVGGVGTSRPLTIRGNDSFSLSQRPVIYIDGIRVDSRGSEWGSGVGGTGFSTTCCAFSGGAGEDRLSDLNPDEIDRIEVLRGPAAATLYGSEASGGVIQVFTKRGRNNSPANFTFGTSVGINRHRANWPTKLRPNFVGRDEGPPIGRTRALDPNQTLIENGLINSYDMTVDGGGEYVTYFVSGGFTYDEGSIKPNDMKKANFRVNLNWTAAENLTVSAVSGYVRNRIWSLQSGNNWLGIYTNALLANPLNTTSEKPYGGGLNVTVEDAQRLQTFADAARFTGGVTLQWNPRSNFKHTARLGLDELTDQKSRVMPFGYHYTYIGTLGERNLGYRLSRSFTGEYLGNLDYDISFMDNMAGSLAFGMQGYWHFQNYQMATGKDFAGDGVTTVSGAARNFGAETRFEEVNIGFFAQNRFDIGDNLFVTGAVRIDGNSAFGENYGFQVYPKADVAYNFSEGVLPAFFSSAKLRAAVGTAGKSPGAFDQFLTYQPSTVLEDEAGVAPDNPGNDALEPEVKLEYEVGMDLGMWHDRIGIDATYFHATTTNALLAIPLPPSEGFASAQWRNVGQILNHGVELGMNATHVDRSSFRWSSGATYSWTHQEILDLGPTATPDSLPIYEGTELKGWTHHRRLGGFWEGFPIQDIIRTQVIGWDPATRTHIRSTYPFYQGNAGLPTHTASLSNDFSLGQSVRVSVQFRGEWGSSVVNSDRGYGVRQLAYDEYLMHLADSLGTPTPASDSVLNRHRLAYPVDSRDHVRLQEVSVSYTLPETVSGRLGLQRTTVTLSGYNLHWWDDCNCTDPSGLYQGGRDFATSSFLALPQARRFLLSFRTRF